MSCDAPDLANRAHSREQRSRHQSERALMLPQPLDVVIARVTALETEVTESLVEERFHFVV